LKLVEESAQLEVAAQQAKEDYQEKLVDIIQDLGPIKDFLADPDTARKEGHRKVCDDGVLLKLQQDELNARNEEIYRLRTIIGGDPLPSEESHLKNTIKHLKGELGRYNDMMKKFIEQSTKAENTIQSY
jgi:hypothetical protein